MSLLVRRGASAVSGKWRGTCQAGSSVKGSSGPSILPRRGAPEPPGTARRESPRSNLEDTSPYKLDPRPSRTIHTRVRWSSRHYSQARYVGYRSRGGPTPRPIGIASLLASVLQAASAS